ncbi:MAG: hypothetical protein IRZ00_13775 [Gemmatimonadetes bacterium]|nr:hypothetical protein [Gemmatimonadota bacterium]
MCGNATTVRRLAPWRKGEAFTFRAEPPILGIEGGAARADPPLDSTSSTPEAPMRALQRATLVALDAIGLSRRELTILAGALGGATGILVGTWWLRRRRC